MSMTFFMGTAKPKAVVPEVKKPPEPPARKKAKGDSRGELRKR